MTDQLIATRRLDADIALVWRVLTTPEHLAAFWGGDHATVPAASVTLDLRVGGHFALNTVGLDGTPGRRLTFRYEVVDEPRLLVLGEPESGIRTEIRLEPVPGGTTITIHQRHVPPELRTSRARRGLAGMLTKLHHVTTELRGRR
ncbi:SRPBCC family protein [Actinoplanes sp. RD1]|uniref:SRPBCC family protein n=1 Tax=Actinoplanes sp. RD1 TaxID=3064538 RepID=UPI0027426806|nr:SRPBCC domain-containing protein [Actinoplanes sp. RD1]